MNARKRKPRRPPVTLACEHCGTLFERTRSQVEWNERNGITRAFCSRACWHEHHNAEHHVYAWTAEEDAYLRANCTLPILEMARALGRTYATVSNRLTHLGLTNKKLRPWTAKDLETLKRLHAKIGIDGVAKLLRRTPAAVQNMWSRSGLAPGRTAPITESEGGTIVHMWDQGRTDREISAKIGHSVSQISHYRHRHGLVRHDGMSAHARRLSGQRSRRRLKQDLGCDSFRELQSLLHRVEAAKKGWPQADTPRQADMLEVLASGPKTKQEVAARVGGVCRSKNNQYVMSAFMRLVRKGLVVNVGRARPGTMQRRCLYALAPGVKKQPIDNQGTVHLAERIAASDEHHNEAREAI